MKFRLPDVLTVICSWYWYHTAQHDQQQQQPTANKEPKKYTFRASSVLFTCVGCYSIYSLLVCFFFFLICLCAIARARERAWLVDIFFSAIRNCKMAKSEKHQRHCDSKWYTTTFVIMCPCSSKKAIRLKRQTHTNAQIHLETIVLYQIAWPHTSPPKYCRLAYLYSTMMCLRL